MAPPIPGPDEGLNAAVAAELRAERAAQELTVQQLADRADVPFPSLRRYLKAERHIDIAVLNALALALSTTPAEIVEAAQIRLAREAGFAAPGLNLVTGLSEGDDDLDEEFEEIAAHDSEGTIEEEQEAPEFP